MYCLVGSNETDTIMSGQLISLLIKQQYVNVQKAIKAQKF